MPTEQALNELGLTVAREALFPGARVRDVAQGPDGALYLLTDRMLRIAR